VTAALPGVATPAAAPLDLLFFCGRTRPPLFWWAIHFLIILLASCLVFTMAISSLVIMGLRFMIFTCLLVGCTTERASTAAVRFFIAMSQSLLSLSSQSLEPECEAAPPLEEAFGAVAGGEETGTDTETSVGAVGTGSAGAGAASTLGSGAGASPTTRVICTSGSASDALAPSIFTATE